MLPVFHTKEIARTEAEIVRLKQQFINDLKFALCVGSLRETAFRVQKMLRGYGIPEHYVQGFLRTPLNQIARAVDQAELKLQGSRQVILMEVQFTHRLGRRPRDKFIYKLQRFLSRFRAQPLFVIQENSDVVVPEIVTPVGRREEHGVEDHHFLPKLLEVHTGESVPKIIDDRNSETDVVKTDPES